MIRILITAVFFLCTIAYTYNSDADVFVVDSSVTFDEINVDSLIVETGGETGNQQPGDYVLFMCSTLSDGDNTFLNPTPGEFNDIDTGQCGNGGFEPGISCAHGIWGTFPDPQQDNGLTCSWTDQEFVAAGGSFRYRNVDVNNPIIASQCDNGFGTVAVAPSIQSEAGAQVVRLYTFRFPQGILCGGGGTSENNLTSFSACANVDVLNISLAAETEFDSTGGQTGQANMPLVSNFSANANWRACTVALRMQTRAVPTMNEWGFIAVAAFMGIAGIWYLRRRQAKA